MHNFSKEEIVEMANSNDETDLRLHWEGDDCEAEETTAKLILADIQERVANGEDEQELWDAAYICTDEDYLKEQEELADLSNET